VTVVDQQYRYLAHSAVTSASGRAAVDLETTGGCGDHPVLAHGFVEHPLVTARALLLVAKVAATRFWTPPNMVAAAIQAADPVVTSWPGGLRFESFSMCCGVYCRFDLDAGSFDGTIHQHGTTNVDVNPPLKAALAKVSASDPLLIRVGHDELAVSTLDGQVIEKQVPLAERWVRGFAEVAAAQSTLDPRLQLQPAGLRQFLTALPTAVDHSAGWISPSGTSARWSTRPTSGAVAAGGVARLRVLRDIAPLLQSLTGFGEAARRSTNGHATTTAWVGEVPGGRFTLALSPGPARGFSGEGLLLQSVATGRGRRSGEHATLAQRLDEAARGRWGYDVAAAAWFARDLPFTRSSIERADGRLANARALVLAGAVTVDRDGSSALVTSGTDTYRVRNVDGGWRCTCPWWGKHGESRGPCKHALATAMQISSLA
jgi:hypothetical protein